MSPGKKVFIVGPGFIGWNVLDLLVAEGYTVTGMVRRKEHGSAIEASGAKAVYGDLHDKAKIIEHTKDHDIIFHTATADDLPSAEAILEGIAERASAGKSTIFIHTSGTSVLNDNALGAFKSEKVFHDNKREEIDSVPDDAPHRQIDLAILRKQQEFGDAAKIAIMIPPLIYGFNPKHRRLTIQVPTLTRFALKHGFAGHIGKGEAVESQIHVLDLARAYLVLLHHMEQSPPSEVLQNPYYFCENGYDCSWKQVATEIGKALHAAGKIKDPNPREIPEDMYDDIFGKYTGVVVGLNSRSRAVRLRQLGWEPREKGWAESFREDELPEILKEEKKESSAYVGSVAS